MEDRLSDLMNLAGRMIVLFGAVALIVRIVGLRSFTKMAGFDFALTVAVGSVIAATLLSQDQPVLRGVAALAILFAVQWIAARLRADVPAIRGALDNAPLMLMDGAEVLEDNLRAARVTRADLMAKLREANVLDLSEVRAVVLEATGDVSVLHGPAGGTPLDRATLLDGVRAQPGARV